MPPKDFKEISNTVDPDLLHNGRTNTIALHYCSMQKAPPFKPLQNK